MPRGQSAVGCRCACPLAAPHTHYYETAEAGSNAARGGLLHELLRLLHAAGRCRLRLAHRCSLTCRQDEVNIRHRYIRQRSAHIMSLSVA